MLRTMKTSLDNMSTMAIELSRAMGIDVTSFEVERDMEQSSQIEKEM